MILRPWRIKWGLIMAPAYVTYLKQVKQGLCCSQAEQKRLLTALEQEILDAFPDADNISLAQIEKQFGPPEMMAQELQQVLPGDAAANAAKKRLHRICLIFSLGLLIVVLIAGSLIYREHIKAENTPPDIIVVTASPEIIVVTPAPRPVELPPESFLPEE